MRPRLHLLPIAIAVVQSLLAQDGDRGAGDPQAGDPRAQARQAMSAWLDSDHDDQAVLDAAVAALVRAGDAGIAELAPELRRLAAVESPTPQQASRRRAFETLLAGFGVAYLQHQIESGMSFAGQHAPLQPLMPEIGELYLRLLLDTPQWFPENRRAFLIAPLRDLYPQPPDAAARQAVREIADDEDFEAELLRETVAYLLAQWGDREPVEARLAELRRRAAEPDEAMGLMAERALARVHYELREHELAGNAHLRFLRRAEGSGEVLLRPSDYYDAACSLALAGRAEAALAELGRAVDLQLDPSTDRAQLLDRALFERDPDLRSLRGTEAFAELVQRAYPDDDGGRRPR